MKRDGGNTTISLLALAISLVAVLFCTIIAFQSASNSANARDLAAALHELSEAIRKL